MIDYDYGLLLFKQHLLRITAEGVTNVQYPLRSTEERSQPVNERDMRLTSDFQLMDEPVPEKKRELILRSFQSLCQTGTETGGESSASHPPIFQMPEKVSFLHPLCSNWDFKRTFS